MFEVYRKTIGIDEYIETFETEEEAKKFADDMTEIHDSDDWEGHKWYKGKFYVWDAGDDTNDMEWYEDADLLCYGDIVD